MKTTPFVWTEGASVSGGHFPKSCSRVFKVLFSESLCTSSETMPQINPSTLAEPTPCSGETGERECHIGWKKECHIA